MAVDYTLVARLQEQVAERLDQEQREFGRGGLSRQDERALTESLIVKVIAERRRWLVETGRAPLLAADEDALRGALESRMFGAGRLDALLADPEIENIDANGCDDVHLTYADGRKDVGEPVADSDEELISQIQVLASYAGRNSRAFDSANPELDLRLPGGHRLSALMGVTARPALSIRKHRIVKARLADLIGTGTMTDEVADFLSAAVRAKLNIVISGATDAGKTTLLRALAAEVPRDERIITIENSLELGLDEDREAHMNVVALEARQANSEGLGEVTLAQLVRRTLRMNPDRVILGEALGPEIVTLLNAMTQGNEGSLSTIHAYSASQVFDRFVTYALQAVEALNEEATCLLAAGAVDLVVFLRKEGEPGDRRRRVVEIVEVDHSEGRRVVTNRLFWSSRREDHAMRTNTPLTEERRERLEDAGWIERGW